MLGLLFLVACLIFLSTFLLAKRLSSSQQQQLEIEHLKVRVGILNRYVEEKQKEQRACWWCNLGRVLGSPGKKELEKTRDMLIKAGFRDDHHIGAYFFIKYGFVLFIALIGLGLWTWFNAKVEIALILPVIALLLPERVLIEMGKMRLNRIKDALPDFLDMANICMNAGLSYLVAFKRVTEELDEMYPEICYEFQYLLDQIQIGVPRQEALKQFAERNPSDEVKELIQVLAQNEKLGTPIGLALNEFSRRLYQQRESKIEEKAAKTSAKMAIIILPFLMLPYFILMIGEKMVMLGRSF
ncbi:type II secretion system F family protein [Hydrogenovibrio sp. JE_KL2]|uniref:type II secretion system F family protein n=1 Tax=Hydrogenovibrio sp. JE_KL2 TaxID=2651188 RepID=UPI00128CED43|nr:type II secretion system F family protein [Hydrogenovibrio sp. JE_KL2]MPQ77577.1 type II secretion system protein [Hydrogenovibrio sp. JE_KL2]